MVDTGSKYDPEHPFPLSLHPTEPYGDVLHCRGEGQLTLNKFEARFDDILKKYPASEEYLKAAGGLYEDTSWQRRAKHTSPLVFCVG